MADSYEGMWLELEAQEALINCLTFEDLLVVLDCDTPLEGLSEAEKGGWLK